MTVIAGAPASLSIGRVLAGTFAAMGRNWAWMLAWAACFSFLPHFVSNWLLGQTALASVRGTNYVAAVLVPISFGLVISVFPESVLGALVSRRIAAGVSGRWPDRPLWNLTTMVHLVTAMLITAIGVYVGFVFLVIPGLWLNVVWGVVGPVVVLEGKDALASIRRSAELTTGRRGKIFVILLIVILMQVAMSVTSFLFQRAFGVTGSPAQVQAFWPIRYAVTSAVSMLYALLNWSSAAILYLELRQLKDGGGAEVMAAVFD
jgi:hypothetical protein